MGWGGGGGGEKVCPSLRSHSGCYALEPSFWVCDLSASFVLYCRNRQYQGGAGMGSPAYVEASQYANANAVRKQVKLSCY